MYVTGMKKSTTVETITAAISFKKQTFNGIAKKHDNTMSKNNKPIDFTHSDITRESSHLV